LLDGEAQVLNFQLRLFQPQIAVQLRLLVAIQLAHGRQFGLQRPARQGKAARLPVGEGFGFRLRRLPILGGERPVAQALRHDSGNADGVAR